MQVARNDAEMKICAVAPGSTRPVLPSTYKISPPPVPISPDPTPNPYPFTRRLTIRAHPASACLEQVCH